MLKRTAPGSASSISREIVSGHCKKNRTGIRQLDQPGIVPAINAWKRTAPGSAPDQPGNRFRQ